MHRSVKLLTGFAIFSLCNLTFISLSSADSGTWSGADSANNTNWSNQLNWVGGLPINVADGSGNTADFNQVDITADTTVNLDSPRTIGNLIFGDLDPTTTPANWILAGGNTLTLAGTTPTITVNPLGTGNTVTISDMLAGTVGMTKSGSGTLILTANNTFTGGVLISGGILNTATSQSGTPNTVLAKQIVTLSNGGTWNFAAGTGAGNTGWGLNVNTGATNPGLNVGTAQPPAYNFAIGATFVAAGQSGTLAPTGSVNVGQVGGGAGSTLNVVVQNGAVFQAMGSWATNAPGASNSGGNLGALNISVPNPGDAARFVLNASTSNVVNNLDRYGVNSLQNTAVNVGAGVTMFTRTGSGGNAITMGSLAGASTAILGGGGGSGGTLATYTIGSLNTDTEYAGTITSENVTTFGSTAGSTNITKIGTGKLTLSGTLSYSPNILTARNANLRGGVTRISAGTLALKNNATIPGGALVVATGLPDPNTPSSIIVATTNGTAATLDVSGTTNTYTYYTDPLNPGTTSVGNGYTTALNQQVLSVGTNSGTIVGPYNHGAGILAPGNTILETGTTTVSSTNVAGTITFAHNSLLPAGTDLSFFGTVTTNPVDMTPTVSKGTVKFDLGSNPTTNTDAIVLASGATANLGGNPQVDFTFLSGLPALGTYTILSAPSGGLSGSVTNWTVGNWPGRAKPTFSQSGTGVTITLAANNLPSNVTWRGTTDGTWDIQNTPNWQNAGVADVYFNGDAVQFLDTYDGVNAPPNTSINLDVTVTPVAVTVNNTTTGVSNYTISSGASTGKISGSATLVKQGNGTLTLLTANDYTGTTNISGGGTIDLQSSGRIGSGALTLNNGTIISTATGFALPATTITASTTNSIVMNGGNGANTIGALTGSGNLSLEGSSTALTVTLASNNSGFTGTLTVNALGVTRLQAGTTAASSYPIVMNAGTLASDSGAATDIGSLSGIAGSILSGFQGGSSSVVKNWNIGGLGQSTTFAGVIANGKGDLATNITKVGAGTWTLSGNNTFSGTTTVSAGSLKLAHAGALTNSTLTSGGTGLVFDSSVAGHQFAIGGLTGSTDLALVDNGGNPIALTVGGSGLVASANVTSSYSGVLSGAGASLTKTGTGTFTTGGNNAYSGPTTIANGTVQLGAADRIANTSNLLLGDKAASTSGTFNAATFSEQLSKLQVKFNSTIDLGAGGSNTLSFANSSSLPWTSGAQLTINNWDSTNHLNHIFVGTGNSGTANSGLSIAALNNIIFGGVGQGAVLVNGELLPGTPPTPLTVGDINQDGHVNAADILPLQDLLTNVDGYLGQHGTFTYGDAVTVGDVNLDSVLNNADLQQLLNNLIAGQGTSSAIPEPGSLVLLGLACPTLWLASRARRARRK